MPLTWAFLYNVPTDNGFNMIVLLAGFESESSDLLRAEFFGKASQQVKVSVILDDKPDEVSYRISKSRKKGK